MTEKTQGDMIREIWQGMYGVPETEEDGIVGDVKEVIKQVTKQNGRITRNTNKINYIIGFLAGIGIISGGTYGVIRLIGG